MCKKPKWEQTNSENNEGLFDNVCRAQQVIYGEGEANATN